MLFHAFRRHPSRGSWHLVSRILNAHKSVNSSLTTSMFWRFWSSTLSGGLVQPPAAGSCGLVLAVPLRYNLSSEHPPSPPRSWVMLWSDPNCRSVGQEGRPFEGRQCCLAGSSIAFRYRWVIALNRQGWTTSEGMDDFEGSGELQPVCLHLRFPGLVPWHNRSTLLAVNCL